LIGVDAVLMRMLFLIGSVPVMVVWLWWEEEYSFVKQQVLEGVLGLKK